MLAQPVVTRPAISTVTGAPPSKFRRQELRVEVITVSPSRRKFTGVVMARPLLLPVKVSSITLGLMSP
ncbi:MAG: hypothetical protein NTZ05_09700 [Chloroflexi bacterium]|nr:hypothetical protein [Chloroflexota bacterium]